MRVLLMIALCLLIPCGCNSHPPSMYKHTPHTYVPFSRCFARMPYPKHTHSVNEQSLCGEGPKYEGVVCPTLMQGQAVRACSQLKPLNCRASWSTSFCSSPVAAIRILKTCTSILHIRTLSCFHAVLLACRTPSILRQLAIPVCPTLMQGHVPTRQC